MSINDQEFQSLQVNCLELQNSIKHHYHYYPQSLSQSSFSDPRELVRSFNGQIEFLFGKCKELSTERLDDDYTIMMNEKAAADCNILKLSLHKSDETVKSLKTEKDYYIKQLDCLRKELESLKAQQDSQICASSISIFNPQESARACMNDKKQQNTQQVKIQGNGSQSKNQNVSIQEQSLAKELTFEMRQKDEALHIKNETIKNLQDSLESQKRHYIQDLEAIKRECQELRESTRAREQQALELAQKYEDLLCCQTVEIPISFMNNGPSKFRGSQNEGQPQYQQARSKSQHRSQFKNKLNFLRDMGDDVQSILDEEESLRVPMSQQNTVKKIKKRARRTSAGPTKHCNQLLNAEYLLTNQIQAAQVAEKALQSVADGDQQILTSMEDLNADLKATQDQFKQLVVEKKQYQEVVDLVQKENDDLKQKFASLLDQFQEYVNTTEQNHEEEEMQQRMGQDQLLQEMQQTIRELETLSENLQAELSEKDELYIHLKKDFHMLELRYQEALQESDCLSGPKSQLIKNLEEEVNYLKKHFEVEISVLSDENIILKRELNEMLPRQRDQHAQQYQNLTLKAGRLNTDSYQNLIGPNQAEIMGHHNHSQHHSESQYNSPLNISPFKTGGRNNGLKAGIPTQSLNKVSSDNNLGSYKQQYPNQQRVREIISSTQNNFDKIKRELQEKERVIEDKNQEILRLRIEVETLTQIPQSINGNTDQEGYLHQQRQALASQLQVSFEVLESQLLKGQRASYQGITGSGHCKTPNRKTTVQNEEQLINTIKEHIIKLNGLLPLIKEVSVGASYHNNSLQFSRPSAQQTPDKFLERDDAKFRFLLEENEALKSHLMELQSNNGEHEDLIQERKGLLHLCEELEEQVKQGHKSLEDALEKMDQMEKELDNKCSESEMVRQRITEIAVLFEKKEIKQKYTFEVLCDFIYDKANRLFTKYENAVKGSKVVQGESIHYLQKSIEALEQENRGMRETIMQTNIIVKEHAPRLCQLIGERYSSIQLEEGGFEQVQNVLQKTEIELKGTKNENIKLKERLQEIHRQGNHPYRTEAASSNSGYRKENERFVDKVSQLQLKISGKSHQFAPYTANGKHEINAKERLESTTSFYSDEEDAVREMAYGKMRSAVDGLYEEQDGFQHIPHEFQGGHHL